MIRFFSNKNFTVGFILSAVVVVVALISLAWTPYDGNKMNARIRLQGPSLQHPLGTDQYGRDTLSRVMVGAVNSIIVGLVTLFPSFLAQIFFIQGVALIGPGRAGIFVNLVPVFASMLAVTFLQEPFEVFHAVALGLVLGGIWLSERSRAF